MPKIEVKLEPHNKSWKSLFNEEAANINQALGENCIEIHHIGSTSIPDIYAKPIIDIMPVVKDLGKVNLYNPNMENIGYTIKGEYGFFMRRFFVKENAFHVHVFEQGSSEIDRHIKFKHWMINNVNDKNAYQNLKQELAIKYKHDRTAYAIAKTAFVSNIERKSGWHGIRICRAFTKDEWIKIKELHKELQSNIKSSDFNNNEENMHLLLFNHNQIIGYAYLKLDNNDPIEILHLCKPYINSEIHDYFTRSIEKWIRCQPIHINN